MVYSLVQLGFKFSEWFAACLGCVVPTESCTTLITAGVLSLTVGYCSCTLPADSLHGLLVGVSP